MGVTCVGLVLFSHLFSSDQHVSVWTDLFSDGSARLVCGWGAGDDELRCKARRKLRHAIKVSVQDANKGSASVVVPKDPTGAGEGYF